MRVDGRKPEEKLRPVTITPGFLKYPIGSCLVETGETMVICTAMIEDKVPPFLKVRLPGGLLQNILCCQEAHTN